MLGLAAPAGAKDDKGPAQIDRVRKAVREAQASPDWRIWRRAEDLVARCTSSQCASIALEAIRSLRDQAKPREKRRAKLGPLVDRLHGRWLAALTKDVKKGDKRRRASTKASIKYFDERRKLIALDAELERCLTLQIWLAHGLGVHLVSQDEAPRGRRLKALEAAWLRSSDRMSQVMWMELLHGLAVPESVPWLQRCLADETLRAAVRATALDLLFERAPEDGLRAARGHVHHDAGRWHLSCSAIRILAAEGSIGDVPQLIDFMQQPGTSRLRHEAHVAATRLTRAHVEPTWQAWRSWWGENGPKTGPQPQSVLPRDWAPDQRSSTDRGRADFFGVPIVRGRILFLLDESGSMRGVRDRVASEFEKSMDRLSEQAFFNLDAFAGGVRRWQSKPVGATPANKVDALKWLRGGDRPASSAGRWSGGGTSLHKPLRRLLMEAALGDGVPEIDTAIVLSDGKVHDHALVREDATRWSRHARVRIHCVGSQRHEFLDALAAIGGGESTVIRPRAR